MYEDDQIMDDYPMDLLDRNGYLKVKEMPNSAPIYEP